MSRRQYNVTEAQPHLSTNHVGQAVVVGRDQAGEIVMRMTPAAAAALAEILTRYEAAHKHLGDQYLAHEYDADLWVHVGVDLLAARAMQLSLGHVETTPVSGYIPPRTAAGAAAVVRSGAPIAGLPVVDVDELAQSSEEVLAAVDCATRSRVGRR